MDEGTVEVGLEGVVVLSAAHRRGSTSCGGGGGVDQSDGTMNE